MALVNFASAKFTKLIILSLNELHCLFCHKLSEPWFWEALGAGVEGDDRGWDGWMASLTWCTWVWVNSRVGDGQGGLACYDSWGRKESDTTEQLNWTELNWCTRLSFTELDKAVICVIRLTSFLWLWFQSVCPLMPSHNTYHLTWVSLTLDGGIPSWLLQQSTAAAP